MALGKMENTIFTGLLVSKSLYMYMTYFFPPHAVLKDMDSTAKLLIYTLKLARLFNYCLFSIVQ